MACNRYCVTYYPEDLPVDLYVRYSRCSDGVTVTELISGLIQTDNGNGTFTSCLCIDEIGPYSSPVCVQNEIEIGCPVDIQWVNTEPCLEEPTPTPTPTTSGEPVGPCTDCVCKEIISERGDDVTYTYTDCYGVFQTSGFLGAMSTVYQCVCFDNQTITFSSGQIDIFVYPNGGCADYQNCDSEVSPTTATPTPTLTMTPTIGVTQEPTETPTSTPTSTSTSTPTVTSTSTPTLTSTSTQGVTSTPTSTSTSTPTLTSTNTSTPTPTLTSTSTSTPTLTSTSAGTCINDTTTPKGVIINFNSGSDYTDCSVFTGLTENTVTGTTIYTTITGGSINISGITPTLLEMYVRIVCVGCCDQTFRVNLDDCCGYVAPTLTNTPTPTVTSTSTPTLTSTSTSTPACSCSTYRIAFNGNCGETLNWTDCDSGLPMSEQAGYFPQYSGTPTTFGGGTVLYLCSCSVPTASCSMSVDLISSGCNLPTPTPTPTSEVTLTSTPTPTTTTPSVPGLSEVIETDYRLNQTSGFTSFSVAAPNSTSAEVVICQILNAHPSSQSQGFSARYYSNPLGVGTRLYGYNTPYAPLNEIIGFVSDGIGILDGGLIYYLKTDVDGYITEYTLMTECQGKPWEIFECTDPCVGGICGCDGQTSTTVFTDSSVTNLTNPGVIVYADAQLLTPFDGFISISGTIYYVSSGTVTVECSGGSGC